MILHIAFEGPIGAGKTTLAKRFAEYVHSDAPLVLEDFDGNAFLSDFYADRPRWALPMQLEFLASRQLQFRQAIARKQDWLIADHTMDKNRVFARMLLTDRELQLYERIADAMSIQDCRPDLIVFLDAPTATLLERIDRRARPYETAITADYLDALRQGYAACLRDADGQRLLRVDTAEFDLTSANAVEAVLDRVLRHARDMGVVGTART